MRPCHIAAAVLITLATCAAASEPPPLNSIEGTIAFWVRLAPPVPETERRQTSRTLLSGRWDDSSYFAFSQGWWEPQGADRLYLIISNADIAHCSSTRPLPVNRWTHVALQWTAEQCLIFVDDRLRARGPLTARPERKLERPVHVGSDAGTPLANGRIAHAEIVGLEVAEIALSAQSRLAHLRRTTPPGITAHPALADLTSPTQLPPPVIKSPRILFDEGPGWLRSREETEVRLRRAANAGFTVYMPTLWHGGGTYVPIDGLPPAAGNLLATRAALRSALASAQRLGVAIHPSITLAHFDGGTVVPELASAAGSPRALRLDSRTVRRAFLDMLDDLLGNFDIAGINLDYARVVDTCRLPACVAAYRRATNRDLNADLASHQSTGEPGSEATVRLRQWNTEIVARFIADLAEHARRRQPNLIISVATHGQTDTNPRSLQGRDAARWARAGWVDWVLDMQYTDELDVAAMQAYRTTLENHARYIPLLATYEHDPLTGQQLTRPLRWVASQTDLSTQQFGQGLGFYLYSLVSPEQWAYFARRFVATDNDT